MLTRFISHADTISSNNVTCLIRKFLNYLGICKVLAGNKLFLEMTLFLGTVDVTRLPLLISETRPRLADTAPCSSVDERPFRPHAAHGAPEMPAPLPCGSRGGSTCPPVGPVWMIP